MRQCAESAPAVQEFLPRWYGTPEPRRRVTLRLSLLPAPLRLATLGLSLLSPPHRPVVRPAHPCLLNFSSFGVSSQVVSFQLAGFLKSLRVSFLPASMSMIASRISFATSCGTRRSTSNCRWTRSCDVSFTNSRCSVKPSGTGLSTMRFVIFSWKMHLATPMKSSRPPGSHSCPAAQAGLWRGAQRPSNPRTQGSANLPSDADLGATLRPDLGQPAPFVLVSSTCIPPHQRCHASPLAGRSAPGRSCVMHCKAS